MNIKKGGIASVIVVIIMVGIVLALIISTVIPMATETRDTAETGVRGFNTLQNRMQGRDDDAPDLVVPPADPEEEPIVADPDRDTI